MRITTFGAAGSVGSRVVAEALARGHDVTAVVHRAARLAELPVEVRARIGDAGRTEDVVELTQGQDLVISATRPPVGQEASLVASTEALLAGLARTEVRLLLVGGAGVLTVPGSGGISVLDHPSYIEPAYGAIARANYGQLEACRAASGVDWTYLSPPASLSPGERTGRYRVGSDELVVDEAGDSTISIEDLAVALLDEAERPQHRRTSFTVGY